MNRDSQQSAAFLKEAASLGHLPLAEAIRQHYRHVRGYTRKAPKYVVPIAPSSLDVRRANAKLSVARLDRIMRNGDKVKRARWAHRHYEARLALGALQ